MLSLTLPTLSLAERPTPEPGAGEVRVRVHAAALNRADLLQRRGGYPAPPGWPEDIPGLEYAGEVEALGPGAARWAVGDRVMGLVGGGGQAECVVVHEDEAMAVPVALDWAEAAAIPEAFLTAWDALVVRGRLQPGERVLIHAAGSGVGTAAVQLSRRLGAVPVGTARSAWKLERLAPFGLAEAIDTTAGRMADALTAPVHLIVDVLGASAWADNLAALAPRGRLVLLGFLGGSRGEFDLGPLLRKRLEVIGSVMRTREREERVALARAFAREALAGFDDGTLRPVVGGTWPMAEAEAAYAALEANRLFGKAVLTW